MITSEKNINKPLLNSLSGFQIFASKLQLMKLKFNQRILIIEI